MHRYGSWTYSPVILLQFTMAFSWKCLDSCVRITRRNSHFFTTRTSWKRQIVCWTRFFTKTSIFVRYIWETKKLNWIYLCKATTTHILKLLEKIAAFRNKLQLWITKMNEGGGQDCFPQLYKYAASTELVVSQDLMALFTEHLSPLVDITNNEIFLSCVIQIILCFHKFHKKKTKV